jgi:hypothetical protein
MEEQLKKALLEAAKWEEQLTESEKTKMAYTEARQCVVNRVFEKYKNLIVKEKCNHNWVSSVAYKGAQYCVICGALQ